MGLLERTRCVRCQTRDRAPGLTVCAACATDLVGRRTVVLHSDGTVVEPEWVRRLHEHARDETGRAA
jgi:hypothetical protein